MTFCQFLINERMRMKVDAAALAREGKSSLTRSEWLEVECGLRMPEVADAEMLNRLMGGNEATWRKMIIDQRILMAIGEIVDDDLLHFIESIAKEPGAITVDSINAMRLIAFPPKPWSRS